MPRYLCASSRQASKRKCAERTARCGCADAGCATGSNSTNASSSSEPGAMYANTSGRLRANLYSELAYNTNSQVKQGSSRHLVVMYNIALIRYDPHG